MDLRETFDGQVAFFSRQIASSGGSGRVRESIEAIYGNGQSDEKIDDEEPPPPRQSVTTVQTRVNPTLQETGKEGTCQTGSGEYGGSFTELFRLVPSSKYVVRADEGGCLKDRLEESNYHDLLRVTCERCAECEKTPYNHRERKPYPGREVLKSEVIRNLSKDIAAVENRVDDIKIFALEMQILLHARHIGVVQISSIEIIDPVHQATKREDEEVELDEKMPLCFGLGWWAPDDCADLEQDPHCRRASFSRYQSRLVNHRQVDGAATGMLSDDLINQQQLSLDCCSEHKPKLLSYSHWRRTRATLRIVLTL